MMCVWAFVGGLLSFSLTCFSPSFTSSLPHSTWSLPGTPSSMSTTPRVKTAAHPHNEEYCSMATYNPLTNTACHTVTSHDTTSHDMTWHYTITHEHIHKHEQTQKTQLQTHITDISQIMFFETKSCYRPTIPAPRPTPASPASQPASQRFLTCGKYVFPPSAVRNGHQCFSRLCESSILPTFWLPWPIPVGKLRFAHWRPGLPPLSAIFDLSV